MTTITVALSLVTCAHADQFKERAKEINNLYTQGVTAMNNGRIAAARAAFTRVLELEPGHGHAKHQLTRLPMVGKNFRLAQRKQKFKTTVLKEIDFYDSTLEEVVETLNLLALKETEKKWSPNFIIQDPRGQVKDKKVSLQMKNIPMSAALQYVLDMTGTTVRFDEHATVIRPQ
ncbi:MAG: hypothetical protein ACSHYF_14175 [Verrucomicrobiaceae bacterium]